MCSEHSLIGAAVSYRACASPMAKCYPAETHQELYREHVDDEKVVKRVHSEVLRTFLAAPDLFLL